MRRLGIASALVFLASAASAQPLALGDVVQSVERAYPLIEAARLDRVAAEAELEVSLGAFDPSLRLRAASELLGGYPNGRVDAQFDQPIAPWGVNLFGGYRLGLGDFAVYDGKLRTNDVGELRAGGSLSLMRGRETDRRRVSAARSEAAQQIAESAFEAQLLEAARAAGQRYWDWVAAGHRVRIAQELLAVAETRDSWLEVRTKSGEVPQIDRVDNRRAIEQRRQGLVSAERAREQAAIELSLYLRNDSGAPVVALPARWRPFPAVVEAPLPSLEPALAAALAKRPEPRRLAAQRRQLELEASLAENQRLPGLDLTVAASKDLGEASDGDVKRGKPVVEGSLLFDVPLQSRLLGGRVKASQAGVSRLEALERLQADRIRADLQDALSALSAARERVVSARRELEAAREVERGERTRYEVGDSSLLFVNLREQQTVETAQREVDALLEYQRALLQWNVARGELPSDA